MQTRRVSWFLARRMRSAWLLLVIVMFTTLVAAALLGALASFSSQVMPQAVHARLAKSPGRAITVIGLVSPRVATTDTAAIRHQLRSALGDVPFRMDTAIWSPPLALTAPAGRSANKAEVATMSRIRAHANLVSGSWPKPARVGRPATVAVPAAVAHQLHLQPGSAMAARDPDSGTRRRLKVTGVYRQRDPTSGYWNLDAIWTCGATSEGCFTRSGPIVVAGSAFTTTALPATQASWVVVPQTGHIETGALDILAGQVGRAAKRLQSPALGGLVVSTGLPELLHATSRHLTAARTLVAAAGLQLILPTLAVLALAARLLAAHRADEAALLGARGASARQLARPSLAEALLTGTASVVLGTLAALGLTDLLANVALPADASIGRVTMTTALWLTEAGTLALCVLVMVWPALRLRAPDAVPGRRTRRAAAAAAVTGADLMLIALAALAVWQLRAHPAGTPLPAGHIGVDPLLAITPVLALAAVSLVPVRVLPALTRVGDRVTDAARRLGPALAGWTLSRRAAHQAGPVLLAVFVVATGTLAFAGHQSWRRSAQDRAAFTTGADVRVDASTPLPLGEVHTVTQASGVTHAMAVAATSTGAGAELLALDAHAAPATVLLRPDLSPLPSRRLWQRVSRGVREPGIALPGHPSRLRVMASLSPGAAAKVSGASATATVRDASGAVYVLAAGTLPADGRRHRLTAVLAPSGRADDPLRLLGLSFTYLLPPFPGRPAGAPTRPARLVIDGLAVAPSSAGRAGGTFATGTALRGWRPVVTVPPSGGRASAPTKPTVGSWRGVGRGAMLLALSPGHQPPPVVLPSGQKLPSKVTATVSVSAPAPARVVPAIATHAFLRQQHLGVGSRISLSVDDASVPARIVAQVSHFPTVTGHDGALIVDQATLQGILASHAQPPLPVTSWWLRTTANDVSSRLRSALPGGDTVISRSGQTTALLGDPLSAVPQLAVLAVAGAMALLAAVGFSVSVAASVRARRAQSALLAALGVARVAQIRVLCAEQLLLALPAAVIGLGAGVGLAYLLVPDTIFTGLSSAPVPPVLVEVPIGWAVLLALVVVATPVLAAAATAVRRSGRESGLREAQPS